MLSLKNIRMIVFDMAGTTLNEGGLVYSSIYNTLTRNNISLDIDELHEFGGMNKYDVIEHFVNRELSDNHKYKERQLFTSKLYLEFNDTLINNYKTNDNITVMPGTYELFSNLKYNNIKIGLNTGYPSSIAKILLNKLQLNSFIDGCVTSDMVSSGRPERYMIHKLMADNNITNSNEVIKVGDTLADIKEGKNAGVKYSIGVLTGVCNRDDFKRANADYILDTIYDINKYL